MARHDIVINKRCMLGHLSTLSTLLLPAWTSYAPKAVKAGGILVPYPRRSSFLQVTLQLKS